MYQVLILDDEKIVRLALKSMIHWEELGFEISGSFGSAANALKAIRERTPDLIISDIVMPDMDGLSFIARAREITADCPIIVLTNHEDFSFSVKAMRYGVMDYVIKTDISPESMIELIQKARAKLESGPPHDSFPLPNNSFGEADLSLLREHLKGKGAVAAKLSAPYAFCMAFLGAEVLCPEAGGGDSSFQNLLSENLTRPRETVLPYRSNASLILLSHAEIPAFLQHAESLCSRIDTLATAYLNIPCGFLLSEGFVDLEGFGRELRRCEAAIPYAAFCGSGRLIRLADTRQLTETPVSLFPLCDLLFAAIDSGDYARAKELFLSFLSSDEFTSAALAPALEALRGLCFSVMLEYPLYLSFEVREALLLRLRQCRTLEEHRGLFASLLTLIAQNRTAFEASCRKSEVAAIIALINENITQHISLSMISESIHMTENYISRLFKSETGMNIINYINLIKMDRARILFREPRNTVRSVASTLGYYEPSYFIKLFRRTYGIGPSEYKKFICDRSIGALLMPAPQEDPMQNP